MHINRYWTTRMFREAIKDFFELEDEEQGHWKMLQYILLCPCQIRVDHKHSPRKIKVSHHLVQSIYGTKKIPTVGLLNNFSNRTGIELNISEYDLDNGKCRTITPSIPDEVLQLRNDELIIPYPMKPDRVDFVTGKPWTKYQENKYLEEQRNIVINSRINESHPAYNVVEFLNGSEVCTSLARRVNNSHQRVMDAIENIENPETKMYALLVYGAITQSPYIKYGCVEKTSRIYAQGMTILALPRKIRNTVLEGCINVDIKNCQVAIVASLWELPLLSNFLSNSGKTIWEKIAEDLKLDLEENKQHFKEIVFGIIFGAGKRRLKEDATDKLGSDAILSHPFIQELLAERDRQLEIIGSNNGGYDGFGKWVNRPEPKKRVKDYKRLKRKNNRSILCEIIQSYELKLMLSVYDEIRKDNNMLVVAWLHDGVFIALRNHKQNSQIRFQRMSNAIANCAESLGIKNVKLDFQEL